MDLGERGKVGRSSLAVAVIGVVIPFAAGGGLSLAVGMSGNAALFVAAAPHATATPPSRRRVLDL